MNAATVEQALGLLALAGIAVLWASARSVRWREWTRFARAVWLWGQQKRRRT